MALSYVSQTLRGVHRDRADTRIWFHVRGILKSNVLRTRTTANRIVRVIIFYDLYHYLLKKRKN